MDKAKLKQEITTKTLSKESYKYLFRVTIVKNLILGFILFLALLFSVINHDKISGFFSLRSNNGKAYTFFYYLTIIVGLILPLGTAIYNLINIVRNKDWTEIAYKINNKLDLPQYIVVTLGILLYIVNNIVSTCNVSGSSMEPNYYDNDKLLFCCVNFDYDIDDVVIFNSTKYDIESSFYIKRVVAADGDVVRYNPDTYELFVNDNFVEHLSLNEYLTITHTLDRDYGDGVFYEFFMTDNQLLVLGDNRDVSRDSRIIGLIYEEDVLGKAFFRILPFDNFGVVR